MQHFTKEKSMRKSLKASRAAGRACLGLLLALMPASVMTACGSEQDNREAASTQAPQISRDAPRQAAPRVEVSPQLPANFALLRTSPDGLPPEVSRILNSPISGMRWDLAQRVPLSLPGSYWLAPGAEALCIVATTPESPAVGTVCARVKQALRYGVTNASLDTKSGKRIVVGVVPDGTRTALVRTDASTASVPVRKGSFVLRDSVNAPPDEVTLR